MITEKRYEGAFLRILRDKMFYDIYNSRNYDRNQMMFINQTTRLIPVRGMNRW